MTVMHKFISSGQMIAFRTAWSLSGRRKLKLIRPVDEWELPAGYSYNARYDSIVTASGARVALDWESWSTYQETKYVPQDYVTNLSMTLPGVMELQTGITVVVPGDEWVNQTLRTVWGIVLADSVLYRLESRNAYPVGDAVPIYYILTLKEDAQK